MSDTRHPARALARERDRVLDSRLVLRVPVPLPLSDHDGYRAARTVRVQGNDGICIPADHASITVRIIVGITTRDTSQGNNHNDQSDPDNHNYGKAAQDPPDCFRLSGLLRRRKRSPLRRRWRMGSLANHRWIWSIDFSRRWFDCIPGRRVPHRSIRIRRRHFVDQRCPIFKTEVEGGISVGAIAVGAAFHLSAQFYGKRYQSSAIA